MGLGIKIIIESFSHTVLTEDLQFSLFKLWWIIMLALLPWFCSNQKFKASLFSLLTSIFKLCHWQNLHLKVIYYSNFHQIT
jgi:hypothetical protein